MAICDYDYDDDKMKMKIQCLGCLYGSSIEDFPECMARTIDKILETKKVKSIVLSREREYEYDYQQVKALQEIAKVIEDVIREGIISSKITSDKCKRCYPDFAPKMQHIVFDLLRKDPVGAYVEIIREIRHLNVMIKKTTNMTYRSCFRFFKKNILNVLRDKLENTEIIKKAKPHLMGYHIGNRDIYRQIFMPSTRPNFMFTRYMITPPEDGESIDRYKVGDTQIEIFKLTESAQNFYFVLPPEFRLSEEKYSVLDAARNFMASHKPKTAEFVKSARVREIFYNIGKDTIRETADKMKIHLSTKDIEELASILTRYTAGFGVLEILLADEKIQDLYINSPIETQPILIYHQNWEECRTNLIPTREDAEAWATRLRIQSGRPLDEANPVLDTDIAIPGGKARFAVITRSLSPEGLGFAVRRHRFKPWTLPLFIKNKMLNPLAAGLLSFLIDGSAAILIAGGRSAGKTSVLGSLMLELLPKTRIVCIQDTLELPIEQMIELNYNIESLKSRSVITRVETEMPAHEVLRTSLRLGDSSLIIGEIRSKEAKALYEAMRVGALSNVVAGTIHGESAYGVFDRVVNDLDVPPTSFKATDMIGICKMLRSADGLHRFRRFTEITEVRKQWKDDPVKEGGFVNLMEYSSKEDTLKPTDTLLNGESEVLNRIASYVSEWSGNWDAVWENIKLRGKLKETIINISEQLKRPELLEANWIMKSNAKFHILQEKIRKETGSADSERVYKEWLEWFKKSVKS